jgi:hypothetical protein
MNREEVLSKIKKLLEAGKINLKNFLRLSLLNLDESPRNTILRVLDDETTGEYHLRNMLVNLCPHDAKRIKMGNSGGCEYCYGADDKGWWCDESPDNCCHYYSSRDDDNKSFVILSDGSKYILPETHDAEHETDDWCIFCENPDERK